MPTVWAANGAPNIFRDQATEIQSQQFRSMYNDVLPLLSFKDSSKLSSLFMTESLFRQMDIISLISFQKSFFCDFDHKIGAATTSVGEASGESGALIK
jgi:hypothetical protein